MKYLYSDMEIYDHIFNIISSVTENRVLVEEIPFLVSSLSVLFIDQVNILLNYIDDSINCHSLFLTYSSPDALVGPDSCSPPSNQNTSSPSRLSHHSSSSSHNSIPLSSFASPSPIVSYVSPCQLDDNDSFNAIVLIFYHLFQQRISLPCLLFIAEQLKIFHS